MGHEGEDYIVRAGNGLEGLDTKGRIDKMLEVPSLRGLGILLTLFPGTYVPGFHISRLRRCFVADR